MPPPRRPRKTPTRKAVSTARRALSAARRKPSKVPGKKKPKKPVIVWTRGRGKPKKKGTAGSLRAAAKTAFNALRKHYGF